MVLKIIVGVCNCSMFCCTLLYVHSSIAIILMGKRELVALLNLSSWCLVMVERLFLAVPQGCLQFVVFPDHTLFLKMLTLKIIRERQKHAQLLNIQSYMQIKIVQNCIVLILFSCLWDHGFHFGTL